MKRGDKVVTVSLSWGGAGDLLHRYEIGKNRLESIYDFEVVECPHTLRGSEYVQNHPEERASELMDAFKDDSIKGIFSTIGGDDSVLLLPHVDLDIIKNNPKPFIGYSDSTVTHFMCYKAGVQSFYGPSILAEFAENVRVFPYTLEYFEKALFETIGEVICPSEWTSERIPWEIENQNKLKKMNRHEGYDVVNGRGVVSGHLIGGCIEVMEFIKGTSIWPTLDTFNGAILFFETSEEMPAPDSFKYWLRHYGSLGILDVVNGMIFGKPYHNQFYGEYKSAILEVMNEFHLDFPVFCNAPFGHTEPMITIPYGDIGILDCENRTFSIKKTS